MIPKNRQICPERAMQPNPGRRPGIHKHQKSSALKVRRISGWLAKAPVYAAHFQRASPFSFLYPGRCPGLVCNAPLGLF
jgi:hypothetical protein